MSEMRTALKVRPLFRSVRVCQASRLLSKGLLLIDRENASVWSMKDGELERIDELELPAPVQLAVEQTDQSRSVILLVSSTHPRSLIRHTAEPTASHARWKYDVLLLGGSREGIPLPAPKLPPGEHHQRELSPCASEISSDLHWPCCAFAVYQGYVHVVALPVEGTDQNRAAIQCFTNEASAAREQHYGKYSHLAKAVLLSGTTKADLRTEHADRRSCQGLAFEPSVKAGATFLMCLLSLTGAQGRSMLYRLAMPILP